MSELAGFVLELGREEACFAGLGYAEADGDSLTYASFPVPGGPYLIIEPCTKPTVIPEPAAAAMIGVVSVGTLFIRHRFM